MDMIMVQAFSELIPSILKAGWYIVLVAEN